MAQDTTDLDAAAEVPAPEGPSQLVAVELGGSVALEPFHLSGIVEVAG